MYKPMPTSTKEDRAYMRIEADVKDGARAVAKLRGLKLSSLINTLLVEETNKERQDRPDLLADALRKVQEQDKMQAEKLKKKVPVTALDANETKRRNVKAQPSRRNGRQSRKRRSA